MWQKAKAQGTGLEAGIVENWNNGSLLPPTSNILAACCKPVLSLSKGCKLLAGFYGFTTVLDNCSRASIRA